MPTKRRFTLKEYEQLIDDVLMPYFQEQNVTHDIDELMKAQGIGQEVPPTEGIENATIQNPNL